MDNYQSNAPYGNNGPVYNQVDPNTQPMRLQDWIVSFLLLLIPIANIVLVFMWAFGSNVNKSKKTFFQAYLIIMAVSTVLSIVFFSAFAALISSLAMGL